MRAFLARNSLIDDHNDWHSLASCSSACSCRLLFRQRDGADRVLARQHDAAGEARQPPRRHRQRLLEQRERLLGALLFGNNAVNIAASALATGVLLTWFGNAGVVYATVVMTISSSCFAEILPKTAAFNAPGPVALPVARPIICRAIPRPGVDVGRALVRWLLKPSA